MKVSEFASDLSFALEFRLRFIDFLLLEYGKVNRRAIVNYFGLSEVQASLDFRKYMVIAPDNMAYDVKEKAYKRTANFKQVWK